MKKTFLPAEKVFLIGLIFLILIFISVQQARAEASGEEKTCVSCHEKENSGKGIVGQ
jgi:nitrate/TMAO reductase-like tetraheme cytochrome c subunit